MRANPDFVRLAQEWGIHFEGAMDYLPDTYRSNFDLAMDAQPTLTTGPNASGGYTPAQVQAAQPTAPTTFPFTTIFTGQNGTVYYGLGNGAPVKAAEAAGYKITTAQAAGVPGGTTKAQYAYKS